MSTKILKVEVRRRSDNSIFDTQEIELKYRKDGSFTSAVQKAIKRTISFAYCGHKAEIEVK